MMVRAECTGRRLPPGMVHGATRRNIVVLVIYLFVVLLGVALTLTAL